MSRLIWHGLPTSLSNANSREQISPRPERCLSSQGTTSASGEQILNHKTLPHKLGANHVTFTNRDRPAAPPLFSQVGALLVVLDLVSHQHGLL